MHTREVAEHATRTGIQQRCYCWEFGGDVTTCKCLHVALTTQLSNAHHLHLSRLHCCFWTKPSKATSPHLSGCLTLTHPVHFPVFFSSCVIISRQHSQETQPLGLLTSQWGCRETAVKADCVKAAKHICVVHELLFVASGHTAPPRSELTRYGSARLVSRVSGSTA